MILERKSSLLQWSLLWHRCLAIMCHAQFSSGLEQLLSYIIVHPFTLYPQLHFSDILHWLVLGSEPGQRLCFNCVSFVTVSLCLLPVVPVALPCPIWKRSRPIWWLMAPANVASSVLSSSTRCCQSVSLFVLLICVFLVRFGNTQQF